MGQGTGHPWARRGQVLASLVAWSRSSPIFDFPLRFDLLFERF